MIEVTKIEVCGWEAAIRGMRNAYNSWDKSDSCLCPGQTFDDCRQDVVNCPRKDNFSEDVFCIGKNDLKLMMNLANAGDDHGKFLRMIVVYMDITAPFYWWKQFDTYKVGSVSLSCSTMHTITSKEFIMNDFSTNEILENAEYVVPVEHEKGPALHILPVRVMENIIYDLNVFRKLYLDTNNKTWWDLIIQTLPESYNQKRTVMLNYQILRHMYKSRKDHKLKEWNDFRKVMEDLPYSGLITGEVKHNES